jgi:chromate transporter
MVPRELFVRFVLISLVAFGGGQAALPLVERVTVHDSGWITPAIFGAAVAFGYLTPGPVLITRTFIGYHVAGLIGAVAATLGAFLAPACFAALTAQQITRFAQDRRLRDFGAGAAPAVIGLLGVTVLDLGREAFASWSYIGIAGLVLVLGATGRVHPVALLALAAGLGWVIGR